MNVQFIFFPFFKLPIPENKSRRPPLANNLFVREKVNLFTTVVLFMRNLNMETLS